MIDITLLGTSSLVPLPGRALTAVALECAGRCILFDCGEGTQTAARAAHVSLMKADVIALTHYHGDHIFGLPGLMQTMTCMGRTDPLFLCGPQGLEQAMGPILKLAGGMSYDIRLLTIPEGGLRLKDLAPLWPVEATLSAFPTEHRVPSQGYCFTLGRAGKFLPEKAQALGVPVQQWGLLQKGQAVEAGGRIIQPAQVLGPERKGLKFVFSGDTMACDSLTDAAFRADLLICEATYGENSQVALAVSHGHMNFAQAAKTALDAEVHSLWLTHYSQMIEDPEAYLPLARDIFPNAQCGRDGMRETLAFEK